MKKILGLAFLVTITVLISLGMALTILAEPQDDDVDGTFTSTGFNNPTEYTKFTIEKDGTTNVESGTAISPKSSYTFTLGVSDQDTLDDIENLAFHFYYQTFDENAVTTEAGNYAVVKWNGAQGGSFEILTNTAITTTWEVTNSTIPALSGKTGEFSFDLTISSVARFTDSAEWKVGLSVTDGGEAEGYTPALVTHAGIQVIASGDPLLGTSAFTMGWYGEIDPGDQNALWASVSPGMDFGDDGAKVTLTGISYISNGNYDRDIKASETWNISGSAAADGSTQAALTITEADVGASSDTSDSQLFAIKADGDSDISGAVLIPLANATESYSTDNGYTTENGVQLDTHLWVAISSRFQNATYSGTITLSIVNTLESE